MEQIKATRPEKGTHALTPLDWSVIGMNNSGSWLFQEKLDLDKLRLSLSEVLNYYPLFYGTLEKDDMLHYDDQGISLEISHRPDLDFIALIKSWELPENFKAQLDLKQYKKGKCTALSVKIVELSDGTLISISLAHLCGDGHTLYQFMHDWSQCYAGKPIEETVFNMNLYKAQNPNKADVIKQLEKRNWFPVKLKALWYHIQDEHYNKQHPEPDSFFIPNSWIERVKEHVQKLYQENISTHSVISALLAKSIFNAIEHDASPLQSVVSVIDLRGYCNIPSRFVGNAVLNVASEPFDCQESLCYIAHIINNSIKQILGDAQNLEEIMQLTFNAIELKLPYISFDLLGSEGKNPRCLIVNDFKKFNIYSLTFGSQPVKVFPNELADSIRIWPAPPQENGFYVLTKGNIGKIMSEIKEKDVLLAKEMECFKEDN